MLYRKKEKRFTDLQKIEFPISALIQMLQIKIRANAVDTNTNFQF